MAFAVLFDVDEPEEMIPWFIFWPICDIAAIAILTVRALKKVFK